MTRLLCLLLAVCLLTSCAVPPRYLPTDATRPDSAEVITQRQTGRALFLTALVGALVIVLVSLAIDAQRQTP